MVIFSIGSQITFAQKNKLNFPILELSTIAEISQNDSYITLPTDIGNIKPLMFEANINPSFTIRERKDSRLIALLTPQIIIRMYNEASYPVKTPSYMPQIAFYYLLNINKAMAKNLLFGKLVHHSNGQDGNFFNEDNTINLSTGNFATNYFEIGFIGTKPSYKLNAIKTIKSSIEVHPKSWMVQELQGRFSGLRWHNTFTAHQLPFINKHKKSRPRFSLKVDTTLMLDNYNELDIIDIDRLNVNVMFYYHPKFLEDIGLFVGYYNGMDYYNIYFEHQLEVIRFGIMTKILKI
tara:strand:+ start:15045 stop:15920 length:876 start_codon:yes stop_codon:yes gene_type:complete